MQNRLSIHLMLRCRDDQNESGLKGQAFKEIPQKKSRSKLERDF